MRKQISTEALHAGIVTAFSPFDPDRIILFGSYARGEEDPHSDVDVIVVYRTDKRFLDRLEELYLRWEFPVAVDILAYTPDEYEEMMEANAFLQDAVAEGVLLYERSG